MPMPAEDRTEVMRAFKERLHDDLDDGTLTFGQPYEVAAEHLANIVDWVLFDSKTRKPFEPASETNPCGLCGWPNVNTAMLICPSHKKK